MMNTLITSEYVPIACPGGVTDIDFTIEGSVGQFDVYIDNVLVSESVEGGTVTVSTDDLDGDGIPDDFVFLSTSTNTIVYGPNQNFWPDGIDFNGDGSIEDNLNDCEDSMTIFINIEDDDDIDNGEGTLSKLLKEDSLYNNLNKTAYDLDKLLNHINENPKHFFAPFGKSSKKIKKDLQKKKN